MKLSKLIEKRNHTCYNCIGAKINSYASLRYGGIKWLEKE